MQINFLFFLFVFFLRDNFNLWRSLLIIALYHQTKTPISFWCRRELNSKSFMLLSEILPVELTRTHIIGELFSFYIFYTSKNNYTKNKKRKDKLKILKLPHWGEVDLKIFSEHLDSRRESQETLSVKWAQPRGWEGMKSLPLREDQLGPLLR